METLESTFERHLAEVLAIHFDPVSGTPYWLDQSERLGCDPREAVRTAADLHRLPCMDAEALRERPLVDFIPRSVVERRGDLIVAQTGGTLGRPVWTAYTRDDFREAFVSPFLRAAEHVAFPGGGAWLYVGPSGPHIIHRAADAIARATGAASPFSVDFDPRWARKLPAGSFAAKRYLAHVAEQALAVVRSQPITHLFTTPTVLSVLAEEMTAEQREDIRGVHYGGMAIDPVLLRRMQTDVFPNAAHLAGYGNTLFGCCLELDVSVGRTLCYFPFGERLVFGVRPDEPGAAVTNEIGREGRLVFSRLDRSMLLLNYVERDRARLVDPPKDSPEPFRLAGVASPTPLVQRGIRPAISLY
ncbi:MAG: hypothetical protein ACE5E1_09370 [Phycisphaerae bacterium]